MRAYFKNMIQAYRGTCDGLVYYYNPRLKRVIVRPWFKPRPCEATLRFGRIAKNLKALKPSEGMRSDLSVYVDIHNRRTANEDVILQNWYNAFTRMMWNLAKESPETIDLEFISRTYIELHDLPCRSVKRAVDAGLLAPLNGYELLTQEM
ncbi:MAG: hypothetical protein K0B87_05915 [Candidatus Syntrophosphaera sp.]|nr:hypothetical protein [Candidatus Syntrophosphaera sp.]